MKNSKSFRSTISVPNNTQVKPSKWERQLQRELQDPNRFYEGDYNMAESFSVKAVRLG